ncbi:hypothetical protein SDC9_118052 [bioreactor metagenome]|uniref:Uncharacterized protein n=1 Tax=bioreactor metagenome TaxID=1076179 RepID=A0A645C0E0_9ZZZZ
MLAVKRIEHDGPGVVKFRQPGSIAAVIKQTVLLDGHESGIAGKNQLAILDFGLKGTRRVFGLVRIGDGRFALADRHHGKEPAAEFHRARGHRFAVHGIDAGRSGQNDLRRFGRGFDLDRQDGTGDLHFRRHRQEVVFGHAVDRINAGVGTRYHELGEFTGREVIEFEFEFARIVAGVDQFRPCNHAFAPAGGAIVAFAFFFAESVSHIHFIGKRMIR